MGRVRAEGQVGSCRWPCPVPVEPPRLGALLSVNVFQGPDRQLPGAHAQGSPSQKQAMDEGRAGGVTRFCRCAGEQTPGVPELPKLEGTPRPQYLAGGRFSGHPYFLMHIGSRRDQPQAS